MVGIDFVAWIVSQNYKTGTFCFDDNKKNGIFPFWLSFSM